MNDWIKEAEQGVLLSVRVIPRAPQHAVDGVLGNVLKIRLSAPPVEGQANEALIAFVAECLDISRSRITLESGTTSRAKRLLVRGLPAQSVSDKLLARSRHA
jgi:uncharacterized protein (TIGR00251 family)